MLIANLEGSPLQFRFLASLVVFIGSYLPLGLILLAQDFRYELLSSPLCSPLVRETCILPFLNGIFPILIFAVCAVCFLLSLGALATIKAKTPVDIKEVKHIPSELMSYTLPYVVSFMGLDYHEVGKMIGLLIFLAWMFLITHRSGQLILNPILSIFGWRLYEIKYVFPGNTEVFTGRALSRTPIEVGKRYNQSATQDILVMQARDTRESDVNT